MKMEQTECSETLAYKIQTPGNYPEESIQQNEVCEIEKNIFKKCVPHISSHDPTCVSTCTCVMWFNESQVCMLWMKPLIIIKYLL